MMAQIASASIFLIMFLFVIWDKFERHIVTLLAGGSTMVLVFGVCMQNPESAMRVLNLGQIFTIEFWYHSGAAASASGINWATIVFIAGMMIMVEGLADAGFFSWLCMTIAKLVRFQPVRVLIAFMIVSAVLSMFIDSITVILFLAAVTVELGKVLRFNPVPVILAEIFCANLGGSATMCGDPPNIIIGTSLGYSFGDFLMNTGVIAGVSLVFVIIYFYLCFRGELKAGSQTAASDRKKGQSLTGTAAAGAVIAAQHTPAFVITDRKGFLKGCGIFALAVLMLVTHSVTGLTVAAIGVIIGLLSLAAAGKNGLKLLQRVDYKTLLFFVGLFIVVGGLEETGTLELLASLIEWISGGNSMVIIVIIIWLSGLASAFVDNIPFAATMIPVIRSLAALQGVDLSVLAWSLAMGTDIGGSATPIGASANVVGTSVAAREGYPISWGKYCLYMVPASIIVLGISTLMVWIRYF
jgi:Na+/H+ antiporter NhaD/arsenite permease-like protein